MGLIRDLGRGKAVEAMGHALAKQFMDRLPLERFDNLKKRAQEIEILIGHAQGLQRKEQLGMIGKSRLVNAFQWELVERGYDATAVREIGYRLARTVAGPKAAKSA